MNDKELFEELKRYQANKPICPNCGERSICRVCGRCAKEHTTNELINCYNSKPLRIISKITPPYINEKTRERQLGDMA